MGGVCEREEGRSIRGRRRNSGETQETERLRAGGNNRRVQEAAGGSRR